MKDIDGIEKILEILEPQWAEIQTDFEANNNRFLQLAAADHEVIGRVLRSHLIVETFMTTFLEAYYGFDDLEAARLGFSQKARLLPSNGHSASFVRPGILQLNSVRNKFGHELDHLVQVHEISGIYQVLKVARASTDFSDPVAATEAFAPIACAFLSVPPKHLQDLFLAAFAEVQTFTPELDE